MRLDVVISLMDQASFPELSSRVPEHYCVASAGLSSNAQDNGCGRERTGPARVLRWATGMRNIGRHT